MIKVSVLYPYEEGKKFDMDYYVNRHMTFCLDKFGAACKRMEVDKGTNSGEPESKPPYVAMGHAYFASMEAYIEASMPHLEAMIADIPNYTDIEPLIQISEMINVKG